MIKLIVTDLDGSLLNDAKEIPEAFWEVLKKAKSQKVKIALASGRPYENMSQTFEKAKEDVYFITDNGSYGVYQQQELFINPMEHEAVAEFIKISRLLPNVFPILCAKRMAYLEDECDELINKALVYYNSYQIVPDLTQVTDIPLKLSLCDLSHNAEANSLPHYAQFADTFKVAVAGDIWLDITSFNANKGNAVKYLQSKYDIAYDETLVFGDFLNDLEMMQAAKYSYAMKNAHPKIIETANYVTAFDNNKGGVVKVMQEFLNQQ